MKFNEILQYVLHCQETLLHCKITIYFVLHTKPLCWWNCLCSEMRDRWFCYRSNERLTVSVSCGLWLLIQPAFRYNTCTIYSSSPSRSNSSTIYSSSPSWSNSSNEWTMMQEYLCEKRDLKKQKTMQTLKWKLTAQTTVILANRSKSTCWDYLGRNDGHTSVFLNKQAVLLCSFNTCYICSHNHWTCIFPSCLCVQCVCAMKFWNIHRWLLW